MMSCGSKPILLTRPVDHYGVVVFNKVPFFGCRLAAILVYGQ